MLTTRSRIARAAVAAGALLAAATGCSGGGSGGNLSPGALVTKATGDIVVGKQYEAVAFSDDLDGARGLIDAERKHDYAARRDALPQLHGWVMPYGHGWTLELGGPPCIVTTDNHRMADDAVKGEDGEVLPEPVACKLKDGAVVYAVSLGKWQN